MFKLLFSNLFSSKRRVRSVVGTPLEQLDARVPLSAHVLSAGTAGEMSVASTSVHPQAKQSVAGSYDTDAEMTILTVTQHGKHLSAKITPLSPTPFGLMGSDVWITDIIQGTGKLKGNNAHLVLTGPGQYVSTGDTGTAKFTLDLTRQMNQYLQGTVSIELNGHIYSSGVNFVYLP